MRRLVLPLMCALAISGCDDKAEQPAAKQEAKADDKAADKKADDKAADKKADEEQPADASALAPAFKSVTVPVGDGDLQKTLDEHIALAKAAKLTPYVELWATWCPPCKKLEASMGDERMQKAFAGVYLIRLDSDEWGDKLKPAGFDNSSIPVFFEIDDTGKPTGRSINGGAWGEDVPENMAPPLDGFFHGDKS